MSKKILYAILICIIIAGIIVISTVGLKADIVYSKNVRIDVYLGKEYDRNEVEKIAKDIFGTNRILVSQVEYFGDMFTLTMKQDVENMDEKIEELNNKLNEKYELENKKEDIIVTYQPNVKLSSIITPYIIPFTICTAVIVIYAIVRFRKLGILKTIAEFLLSILGSGAVYLSVLAIVRIPINRLVVPIGLVIYIAVITYITAKLERKLENNEKGNKNK